MTEAVRRVLAQNYEPLEIIVVDDGSTDETAEIAARMKDDIHYIRQPNKGPSAARNRGLRQAKNDVIAFLDVDDYWADNVLRKYTEYLSDHPSVGIVQGLIQKVRNVSSDPGGGKPAFENAGDPYHFGNIGSALYRSEVFGAVGPFDETMRHAEDADWFIRAWEKNIPKVVLNEVMLYYRKHDDGITFGMDQRSDKFRLVKKHMDRYRVRHGAIHGKRTRRAPEYSGIHRTAGALRTNPAQNGPADRSNDRTG